MVDSNHRNERRYPQEPDQRTPAQRDRDRILYSSAFRRLGGVTQVVAPTEGHVFHNRLTHSLKVAQVGRRLAEHLVRENPALGIVAEGGIDPDVVEAAALAHDLGHPPFGHVAEEELDRLARAESPPCSYVSQRYGGDNPWVSDREGFEGNPQSFRILTRLESHMVGRRGLNVTRATLNAVMKYPWLRGAGPPGHSPNKFGAYESDGIDFEFARVGIRANERSIEAEIMDHADNITYSIHDLEDFFRIGLIPAQLGLVDRLVQDLVEDWKRELQERGNDELVRLVEKADTDTLMHLLYDLFGEDPYRERAALRHGTSVLIGEFLRATSLSEEDGQAVLHVDDSVRLQMKFLQRVVWVNVIANPRLSTQQEGQKRIIKGLFCTYLSAIERERMEMLPPAFAKDLAELQDLDPASDERRRAEVRLAIDVVASFTDAEALMMHRRLTGVAPGSIADLLHG